MVALDTVYITTTLMATANKNIRFWVENACFICNFSRV